MFAQVLPIRRYDWSAELFGNRRNYRMLQTVNPDQTIAMIIVAGFSAWCRHVVMRGLRRRYSRKSACASV